VSTVDSIETIRFYDHGDIVQAIALDT